MNYGSCQTWATICQYEKQAFDWLTVINLLTHTLPYVVWQHPIYSKGFFFFECNCAHVCALLGIINRLKVVVEAGEVHLYAAWDEPGSDEGKTALLPSRWPAGGPPHIFYGSLGIYINFSKASTFMSSAGTREGWANGAGGRIKCEIEMSEIIHFKSPEIFIYCVDRTTTFNYLKWLSIALIYLMNGSDLLT